MSPNTSLTRTTTALIVLLILRKLSFGTQSRRGSRYVERALSATVTLREQRRLVFPFLVDALHDHLDHDKAPSLLPVIG